MAQKIHGVKAVLKDARARALIIVILVIALVAGVLTFLSLHKKGQQGVAAAVQLGGVPDVQSVPGIGNPSREYVQLQQEENILQAEQAAKTGKSAVPTITRANYLGPATFSSPDTQAKPGCSVEELRRARAAGVKAEELRCKGCSAAALRAAGYTAGELMNAGFNAKDLLAAGYSPSQLRAAGYTAAELLRAGLTPDQLAAAGFNAADLSQAGVSPQQLANAGMTNQQLKAAGIGVALSNNLPKNCNIDSLTTARNAGVPAAELRRMGCSAAALKAAGYSAAELKAAGFNAQELKDAGFSAQQLKDAGFTAGDLRQAGFSANTLKASGFGADALRNAGYSAEEMNNAGFTPDQLKAAGFSNGDLVRAGLVSPSTLAQAASPSQIAPSPTNTPPGMISAVPSITSNNDATTAALEQLQRQQAQQLSAQERQQMMQELQTAMASQANQLYASWAPPQPQTFVVGQDNAQATGQAAAGKGGAANQAQPVTNPKDIIKAGSVLFATLDTSINSDEQSPIMATVVAGPLKGSKVLGAFERVDKKVVIKFSRINIPNLTNTLALNAVAIDANTARTAMASDVDNHYLLRYGTLFASAFLSGMGQAIQNSGATTQTSLFGTTTTYPPLKTSDQIRVALGNVGTQYANRLSSNFTVPPTVKVSAGTSMGVLLMEDLNINKRGSSS